MKAMVIQTTVYELLPIILNGLISGGVRVNNSADSVKEKAYNSVHLVLHGVTIDPTRIPWGSDSLSAMTSIIGSKEA